MLLVGFLEAPGWPLREQNVGLDRTLDCPRMALLTFLSTMEFSEIARASDMLRSHFEFSGG